MTIVITFVTIVSECSVSSKKILEYTYCHDIPHLDRNKKNFWGTGFYQTLEIKYTAKNHGDKIFNDDFIKSMYEIVKLSACSIAILTKLWAVILFMFQWQKENGFSNVILRFFQQSTRQISIWREFQTDKTECLERLSKVTSIITSDYFWKERQPSQRNNIVLETKSTWFKSSWSTMNESRKNNILYIMQSRSLDCLKMFPKTPARQVLM